MDMKLIKAEKRLCMCCMEEHEVKTVLVKEKTIFKNQKVMYDAFYLYCDAAKELYMDEQQIQENDVRLKDAYRKTEGLLTSDEISDIRVKYGISQRDFCILLGWGGKTITRYEGHQVQDKAHDTILRKINQDSEWFLSLLEDSKEHFPLETYLRYFNAARALYEKNQDFYLRKAIEAQYAKFRGNRMFHGNAELSLDKVVDVIRYFAASKEVANLYKVKLMKLLWYADALSYKSKGSAITGLVYQALPMGAVPIGHDSILALKNVPCEEVDMGEANAYFFSLEEADAFPYLSENEKGVLNRVIKKLGQMTKKEIVTFMHHESAYLQTEPWAIISFQHALDLQI